jgi:hypothetical protein
MSMASGTVVIHKFTAIKSVFSQLRDLVFTLPKRRGAKNYQGFARKGLQVRLNSVGAAVRNFDGLGQ